MKFTLNVRWHISMGISVSSSLIWGVGVKGSSVLYHRLTWLKEVSVSSSATCLADALKTENMARALSHSVISISSLQNTVLWHYPAYFPKFVVDCEWNETKNNKKMQTKGLWILFLCFITWLYCILSNILTQNKDVLIQSELGIITCKYFLLQTQNVIVLIQDHIYQKWKAWKGKG